MICRRKRTPVSGDDHAQGASSDKDHARQTPSSNPAAGQGKVPVTAERMDAIRNIKTMAGSPDADLAKATSISPSCAWSLCFWAPRSREPMKEDHYVQ